MKIEEDKEEITVPIGSCQSSISASTVNVAAVTVSWVGSDERQVSPLFRPSPTTIPTSASSTLPPPLLPRKSSSEFQERRSSIEKCLRRLVPSLPPDSSTTGVKGLQSSPTDDYDDCVVYSSAFGSRCSLLASETGRKTVEQPSSASRPLSALVAR